MVTRDQQFGLAAGETADAFYFPTEGPSSERLYIFTIDAAQVTEMDKTNNKLEERIALCL